MRASPSASTGERASTCFTMAPLTNPITNAAFFVKVALQLGVRSLVIFRSFEISAAIEGRIGIGGDVILSNTLQGKERKNKSERGAQGISRPGEQVQHSQIGLRANVRRPRNFA